MFVYEGIEYSSKASCVRALYEKGEVDMSASSKKLLAEKLEMTVQTVHATLSKISNKNDKPKNEFDDQKQKQKIKSKNEEIVKKALTNSIQSVPDNRNEDEYRFPVDFSPNPWGLPVCNPPIYIIDKKFTNKSLRDWQPDPVVLYNPELN
jgi:hypothetical protein